MQKTERILNWMERYSNGWELSWEIGLLDWLTDSLSLCRKKAEERKEQIPGLEY